MTREWVSKKDHRWVMRCDQIGCATRSEPFPKEPPLELFARRGWFIAAKFGDICPTCFAKGIKPTAAPHKAYAAGKATA